MVNGPWTVTVKSGRMEILRVVALDPHCTHTNYLHRRGKNLGFYQNLNNVKYSLLLLSIIIKTKIIMHQTILKGTNTNVS